MKNALIHKPISSLILGILFVIGLPVLVLAGPCITEVGGDNDYAPACASGYFHIGGNVTFKVNENGTNMDNYWFVLKPVWGGSDQCAFSGDFDGGESNRYQSSQSSSCSIPNGIYYGQLTYYPDRSTTLTWTPFPYYERP